MPSPPHLGPFPTLNALWAALWVEELIRQGVGLFVVCPGSRSTPLALALADNPRAETVVHWDERAAAFLALGWGRATGRLAAVVTTSGTAVANLLPAVAEADAAGVPLILLTADRPVELRETGANQTLRQPPLLAGVTRWTFDVPAPSDEVDPAFVLTTAGQAVARAASHAGPVHLNLAFREPLAPPAQAEATLALPNHLARWAASADVYTAQVTGAEADWATWGDAWPEWILTDGVRGLIVLGECRPSATGAVLELASDLGWPVWADLLGGARLGPPRGAPPSLDFTDGRVRYGDAVLADPQRLDALRPDVVIQFGARPVSKRLAGAVRAWAPEVYAVVSPSAARLDPSHRVTHRIRANPDAAAREMRATRRAPASWRSAWLDAEAAVARPMDRALAASGLSEPFVARAVTRLAPEGTALVAAASMPVRDLDTFGTAGGAWSNVFANRGASGIDGTVATAAGVARGAGELTVLLTGDLALLHDLTSLALLRDGPPVVVVTVNNDGGGIFHKLPVAEAAAPSAFERFFGTPHGLGFERAADWAGLTYARPETQGAFESAFTEAVGRGTSSVIEVRTDRAEQAALRQRIAERL